ncbi:MAG: ABC transporter ATP-binding protein [Nitrospinota bacterium]|nr:ABC transporter ATP-binding protein [Nitrospinota bacterium]
MKNETLSNVISFENFSFRYPDSEFEALRKINFEIQRGDIILITGSSGCGKSTLLKSICGFTPRETGGSSEGRLYISGNEISKFSIRQISQTIGFLFQDCENQLICSNVREELAFGPQNLGLKKNEILNRIDFALEMTKSKKLEFNNCTNLSGGEKQKIALASILAMKPEILLLDEPTSQSDHEGVKSFSRSISEIKSNYNPTIIFAEHRNNRIMPIANRLVIMEKGSIVGDFRKREFSDAYEILNKLKLEIPSWIEISKKMNLTNIKNEDDFMQASNSLKKKRESSEQNPKMNKGNTKKLLSVKNVTFSYAKNKSNILEDISFELFDGEILAIMGANGTGKTTLLNLLSGFLSPKKGEINWFERNKFKPFSLVGKIGYLFQNPDLMLSLDTVEKEIQFGPNNFKFEKSKTNKLILESLDFFELSQLKQKSPFAISQGERLRLAIASLYSCENQVLILDEPTGGMNRGMRTTIMDQLKKWANKKNEKRAIILCTHDTETTLKYADKTIILENGEIVIQGNTDTVISKACSDKRYIEPPPHAYISKMSGYEKLPRTLELFIRGTQTNCKI